MSGIAGILHLDGSPVEAGVLERLTRFMAFRGPDGCETRVSGSIGFGHAMLRTAADGPGAIQPCLVGDAVWVVADSRLDGRSELMAKLAPAAGQHGREPTDAELIGHAYLRWGRRCVDHLLGDFAFAVWDGAARTLFCARDHFGIKPFYFAHGDAVFLFSNTLDCLRQHPRVSRALDDDAIGDFLLFDRIRETAATAFAGIRRLPAAHALTVTAGGVAIQRYWTLPTDGRVRYRDARDYTDHFARLLMAAVGDRLRGEPAGMLMSGGVDSTAVASSASRLPDAPGMRGYTFVYDHLMPDDERHYAGLAARAIGMPIEFWPVDGYTLFERCDDEASRKPEPYHWPLEAATLDLYRHIAASYRIVLTGQGGDPLSYFGSLLNTPRFHAQLPDAAAYVLTRRRCPPLGVRTKMRRMLGGAPAPAYPAWLNAHFAARRGLRERFARLSAPPATVHPTHAVAHAMLSSSYWPSMFEAFDPGATRLPLEFRHPLFDVRLVEYVLSIPLVPWSVDKELLRSASDGVQPDEVRRRGKSPLHGDPIEAHRRNGGLPAATTGRPMDGLGNYVNLDAMRRALDAGNAARRWVDLRPVSLNLWLRHA